MSTITTIRLNTPTKETLQMSTITIPFDHVETTEAPPKGGRRLRRGAKISPPKGGMKGGVGLIRKASAAAVVAFHTGTRAVKRSILKLWKMVTSPQFLGIVGFAIAVGVLVGLTIAQFWLLFSLVMMISPTTGGVIAYYIVAFTMAVLGWTPLSLGINIAARLNNN